MGGGGSKIDNTQAQLQSTAATQAATGAKLAGEGEQLINTGQAEQAPLVSFLKSIIGGNSTTTNQALAPVLGTIAHQTTTNREHIFDSTTPGAARDVLLGQNKLNEGAEIAGSTNDVFLKAFPQLAALASGNTNAGLGLTGAGITSTGNGASTTGTVLNAQEQQKANQMSAFTGLAGTAGKLVTGLHTPGGG